MSNRRKNSDASAGFYLALAAAGAIAYFVMRPRASKSTDTQNSGGMFDSQSLENAYARYQAVTANPSVISASFGRDIDISPYKEMPYDRALQIQKNLRHFTIPEVHDFLQLDGKYGYDTDFLFRCFVYWCICAVQLKLEDQALDPTVASASYQLLGENGIFAGGGLECALNHVMLNEESDFEPWNIVYNCPEYNAIYFRFGDTAFPLLRSAYEYLSTRDIAEFNCNPSPRTGEMPWNSNNSADGCNYTVADRKYMQLASDKLNQIGFVA